MPLVSNSDFLNRQLWTDNGEKTDLCVPLIQQRELSLRQKLIVSLQAGRTETLMHTRAPSTRCTYRKSTLTTKVSASMQRQESGIPEGLRYIASPQSMIKYFRMICLKGTQLWHFCRYHEE